MDTQTKFFDFRKLSSIKSNMDKSMTEAIVATILEDLLNELPIENQENEDLDEAIESQPSNNSDEDLSEYASDESQSNDDFWKDGRVWHFG